MKGDVRKAQDAYYSKVQFTLLSSVLKEQKEERPNYKCHRADTSQVGLKVAERACGSRNGGTCTSRWRLEQKRKVATDTQMHASRT